MVNLEQSWAAAETACIAWVKTLAGAGVNGYAGDDLPDPTEELNCYAFQIPGAEDVDQTQDWGQTTPAGCWLTTAKLIGNFATREQAMKLGGLLYDNKPNQRGGTSKGLDPNVRCFEPIRFPRIRTVKLFNGANGQWAATYYELTLQFRVEFSNEITT